MKFFKTIPKLPKHKEPTFSHQHTYMYIANTHVNTEPPIHLPPTHHTYMYMYLLHVPTCTCYIFTLYAHTCTHVRMYVHVCARTCTYLYVHTCTHYVHVHVHVHCTRTFFTFIPILNKHKNYHQNLKLRKVLFIKKFQKGEHKKATTHHTVKTHVSILSIQTCPPLSVLCQKYPYTSD